MATNKIEFQIGYTVDKTGLNEIQKALKEVQVEAAKAGQSGTLSKELQGAAESAKKLQTILNDSWNSKLNQLDLSKLNNSIKSSYGSVEKLKASLTLAGSAGSSGAEAAATAYNRFASSVLNTNLQLKQSNKLLDEMATTMTNTVKWGITSSIFNNITSSIQSAYSYTKNLDSALNDIRIVTDKSAESMETFAKQANSAAKALGSSTLNYTEASLIYYQQGLSDEESKARTETTLKAANVTGQTGEEVSDELTAVWNGYKVTAEETELYVDKLAAVAATTASDLEELSTGMSKVASAANNMGVDIDQLNGMMSTIISVTREAPESVGTALKTIFARMEDLELDGEDEYGVSLGTVSSSLESMGVSILDAEGNMRDLGEVIEEVGNKWNSGAWSDAEKQALAIDLAGKRQYNNLLSLFDNWEMYTSAVETSTNAVGTLQEQQDIYMESTAAHLAQLSTEADRTYDILFDQDTVNSFADAISNTLSIFNDFIDGIGGGGKAFVYLGTLVASVFNKQISQGINNAIANFKTLKSNAKDLSFVQEVLRTETGVDNRNIVQKAKDSITNKLVGNTGASYKNEVNSKVDSAKTSGLSEKELKLNQQILAVSKNLTTEQYNQLNANKQEILQLEEKIKEIETFSSESTMSYEARKGLINAENSLIKEESQNYTKIKALIKEMTAINQDEEVVMEDQIALEEQAISILEERSIIEGKENLLTKEQLEVLSNIEKKYQEGNIEQKLSSTEINTILEAQNTILEAQHQFKNQLVKDAELQKLAEDGVTEEYRQQQAELQKNIDYTTKNAESLGKTANITKAVTILAGSLTAISGVLETVTDKTASASEKTTAWGSAISAVAMSAGMAFGPVGMAIGAVVSTASGVITNAIAKNQEEHEEAIEQVKEDWESLKTSAQDTFSNISTLKDVQSEFDYLSTGVSRYGENISLTADEYSRYQDIIEEIVGISPDVVKGYNSEGQAIVDNNGLIEKTIELLKQQQLEQKKALLTSSNIQLMAEGAQTDYDNATSDYDKLVTKKNKIGKKDSNYTDITQFLRNAGADLDYENQLGEYLSDPSTINVEKIAKNPEAFFKDVKDYSDYAGLTAEDYDFEEFKDKIYEYIDEYEGMADELEDAQDDILKAKQSMDDKVLTYLEVYNSSYDELGTAQQLAIQNYVNSLETTDFSEEGFEELTDKGQEFYDKIAALKEEDVELLNELSDPSNYPTYQDYIQAIADGKQELIQAGLTPEDLRQIFGLTYLEENDDKIGSEWIGEINQLQEQIREQLGWDDFNIYEYFSYDELKNGSFENLGGIDFSAIGGPDSSAIDKINEFFDLMRVKEYNNELDATSESYSQILTNIESIDNGLKEFQEDGEISAETIASLENKYSELSDIQDKGSHEYLEALRQIREQEEDNARQALEDEKETLQKKLDYYNNLDWDSLSQVQLEANTKDFEDTMQELLDTDYQISVQVDADLASDVEDAFGLADEFSKLQELVADDLTVTFDEAQELINQGYGAILENAQETSSQEILLDKATMNAFIDNRQSELEADKESKIQQLENQRSLLVTQKEALQDKLKALQEAASAETKTDALTALEKAQNSDKEYQAAVEALNATLDSEANTATETENINQDLFNDLGGMYETNVSNQENAAEEATNNEVENLKARVSNVQQLYEAYLAVGSANRASADGSTPIDFPKSTFSAGVSSALWNATNVTAEEVTTEKNEPKSLENIVDEIWNDEDNSVFDDTIQALIDATNAQIDGLDSQIGSIDAGIAALKSATTSLDKAQKDAKVKSDSSSKDPEELKYLENEADRYHDIDLEIKSISTDLSKLQKAQSKLTGKDLINNLNLQLKTLEKQKAAYSDKIKLAQTEAEEIQESLAAQGVTFDSDGNISNYAEAYQAKTDYVNSIRAKYNAMSADEQEAYQKTLEAVEDDYEKFKEQIESYDTLISDTIPGLEEDIQEAVDQEIEINITKFDMEVDLKLNMKSLQEQWLEFKQKVINKDDSNLGTAQTSLESIQGYYYKWNSETGTYDENGTGDSLLEAQAKKVTNLNNILANWDYDADPNDTNANGGFGLDRQAALDDLKESNSELMSSLENIEDLSDSIQQSYLDMIDEATDAFDKQQDTYEFINDQIEHDKNVIGLLYGDDAYESMSKYYEKQKQNNNEELDFLKRRVAYAQEMYEKATTDEEREKWLSEYESSLSSLNSKVEESIQTIIDDYQNTISGIISDLEKQLTGGLSLDDVSEEWGLINMCADQYLDTINSAYEVQKLENKYIQSINDTDSISAQKKLKELMEDQVSALKEKGELTQYEVDRANMLYEIALKEIALEEAQQNKSTMHLRRDSQGNYSYEYVADQDKIAEAQQALSDAYNSLYNFDKDAYEQNLQDALTAEQEYLQKRAEILDDTTLTDAEREKKLATLDQYYNEYMTRITKENEEIKANLKESTVQAYNDTYLEDADNVQKMSDAEVDTLMKTLVPGWDGAIQTMIDGMTGEDGFKNAHQDAWDSAEEAIEKYSEDVDDVAEAAGVDFEEISEGIDGTIDYTQDLLENNEDLIDSYDDELDAIRDVIDALEDLKDKYDEVYESAVNAATVAYTTLQTENNKTANAAADDKSSDSNTQVTTETTTTDNSKDKKSKTETKTEETTQGNGKVELGDKVTLNSDGKYYVDSDGSGKGYSKYAGTKTSLYITKIASGKNYPYHLSTKNTPPTSPANQYQVGWVKKSAISGYDTGGYTGEWGNDGKLAVLHQKELVLNKDDTENMLSAVQIVRDLSSILDSVNSSVSDRIASLLSGLTTSFSNVGGNGNNNTLEQNVKIEANFPNVNNSKEIEDAFNNLTNIASQYAYRTQK